MKSPTVHREVERKLRVSTQFGLPDLAHEGAVASVAVHEPFTMRAVYHDTEALTLFRWRTTLRRREGGTDEGWHLKLPVAGADESSRDEMRMPLSSGPIGAVPAALVDVISPLIRGGRLVPLVTVQTIRTPHLLFDSSGTQLLELVDDHVTVLDPTGAVLTAFREIEVELVDHEDVSALAMLERVVTCLVGHGAVASSVSKAASALGAGASAPADVPEAPMPGEKGLAIDAMRSAFATYVRQLIFADVAVRRDLPDSVHQMRVAARRLRSSLKSFRPLFAPDWAEALGDELSWLAAELGAIRDTEVLLERLESHALHLRADTPAEADDDAARAHAVIDIRLRQRIAAARSGALGALRSDRHEWLLDDLVVAAAAPSVRDDAFEPCSHVLPPLVRKTWRSLEKSVRALDIEGPSEDWHRARIKAKRARYAADIVAPIFGKAAMRYARALAEVTEALGEHQDASVARDILRELALAPGVDAATAFALGRLHSFEAGQELNARAAFKRLWPDVARAADRSGLVGHARG